MHELGSAHELISHYGYGAVGVVAAAAVGAILGDNVGYWIGREIGDRLLLRYGRYVGLTEPRIKLGQYPFLHPCAKVVFFGRFSAALRVLAAVLAGVNRMEWRSFLIANAAGGVLWSLVYGVGAYMFGTVVFHAAKPLGIALAVVALIIIVLTVRYVRGHEVELERRAGAGWARALRPPDRLRRRRPQ